MSGPSAEAARPFLYAVVAADSDAEARRRVRGAMGTLAGAEQVRVYAVVPLKLHKVGP